MCFGVQALTHVHTHIDDVPFCAWLLSRTRPGTRAQALRVCRTTHNKTSCSLVSRRFSSPIALLSMNGKRVSFIYFPCLVNEGRVYYVTVSKIQSKPFCSLDLATQLYLQDDLTVWQNGVNYDVFVQTPFLFAKLGTQLTDRGDEELGPSSAGCCEVDLLRRPKPLSLTIWLARKLQSKNTLHVSAYDV